MLDWLEKSKLKSLIFPLVLIISGLLVYAQSFENGLLYWDDYFQISTNFFVQAPNWSNLQSLFKFETNSLGMYQPLTTLFIALQKIIFSDGWIGFHFSSFFLHLINAYLLAYLLNKYFKDKLIAQLCALLFLIAPSNVETVAWISAQSTLLYTFFGLISLIFYHRFIITTNKYQTGTILYYTLALFSFILAVLAKAPAIAFVPIIFLLDLQQSKKVIISSLRTLPFIIISLATVSVAYYIRHLSHSTPWDLISYSTWQYLLINLSSYGWYLQKILVPYTATGLEPYPSFLNASDWWRSIIPATIGSLGVVSLIIYRRYQRYFWAGLIFYGTLIVFSKWDQSSTPFIADRYLYLSALPIYYLIATFIVKSLQKFPLSKYLVGAYFIYLIFLASIFTNYWNNDYSAWTMVIDKHPDFARAYANRAETLFKIKKFDLALEDYQKCSQLDPSNFSCLGNQGVILHDVYHQTEKALELAERASEINPLADGAYYRIALAKLKLGDVVGAKLALKKALIIAPETMEYQNLEQKLNNYE